MNRSILIVICDFFLVSLLAFSSQDISKLSQTSSGSASKMTATSNQITPRQDLTNAMGMALEQERRNRNVLEAEVARLQQTASARAQEITNVQAQLRRAEQLQTQLYEQETNLMTQVALAQTNAAALSEQLRNAREETARTDAERAKLEAEVRKQLERAGVLEGQLAGLQESNQIIQADRVALNTRLQVTEAARQTALERATELQGEVVAQHAVNVKLAESVNTLAAQSTNLAHEISANHELTPNEVFEQLATNRVMASFYGLKRGIFGTDSSKYKQTRILLAADGTNLFAVCHVQDTLLSLWNPALWEDLSGSLIHESAVFSINSISFNIQDPRVVLIPVSPAEARSLACKPYRLAEDPFKFQDAVVAGTQDNYYGECKFQMDTETPGYLKMDHNSLKGIFGKFNPSGGDLVLSKTGELLGLMVNNNYCLVLSSLRPGARLKFGWETENPDTAQTFSELYALVTKMPFRLQ
jgi:hypothetical protein